MWYYERFQLPETTRVDVNITKEFFYRSFDFRPNEKSLLKNKKVNIKWFASLKLSKSNIPSFINDIYSYEEIQMITCSLPDRSINNDKEKYIDLIQKYIPYPIILIVEDSETYVINTAIKRINQNNYMKRTVEQMQSTPTLSKLYANDMQERFYSSITYDHIDKTNLQTTYLSYHDAIVNFNVAIKSGVFNQENKLRRAENIAFLDKINTLEDELVSLNSKIKKVSNFNDKVNLNIQIQEKKKTIKTLKQELNS